MKVHALILAGGRGQRAGYSIPKQFIPIGGIPLIARTIKAFQNHGAVSSITVVSPPEFLVKIIEIKNEYSLDKIINIVEGGATRQESSRKAVDSLSCAPDDIVLIHDAARPFVSNSVITRVIDVSGIEGAAEPCIMTADTVAEVDSSGRIVSIPLRENLRLCQTPQGFRYDIIRNAHINAANEGITVSDDISLVLLNGGTAFAVDGDARNIKITSAGDFLTAEAILKSGGL